MTLFFLFFLMSAVAVLWNSYETMDRYIYYIGKIRCLEGITEILQTPEGTKTRKKLERRVGVRSEADWLYSVKYSLCFDLRKQGGIYDLRICFYELLNQFTIDDRGRANKRIQEEILTLGSYMKENGILATFDEAEIQQIFDTCAVA